MVKFLRPSAAVAALLLSVMALAACGGSEQADSNLPTRRAKMRDIKLSTDRMMAVLQNRSLEGVAKDALAIREALGEVIDLYPEEHKQKYVDYNKEAQRIAASLATQAQAGNVSAATKEFRNLVPTCGKCHEDCAYMLAPAFPEYME